MKRVQLTDELAQREKPRIALFAKAWRTVAVAALAFVAVGLITATALAYSARKTF